MNEFHHWFEGSLFKLIKAETLKQDAETAVNGALERLTKKFGMRQDTALEMRDEVSTTTANLAAKKESSSAPMKKPATGNCPRFDATHKLDACPIYSEMTSSDHRRFMKNQGLCFRCMTSGHMAKACDSGIKCDKCDIPPHPMLHLAPGEVKQPTGKNSGTKTESASV